MRVLVACEFSGVVRDAFRARGHDAWSCDILPSGSKYHIQQDVMSLPSLFPSTPMDREILDQRPDFGWQLVIAHPPCTHLSSSGARWWREKKADGRQQSGIDFFMRFTTLTCKWAIENPIGIMSTNYRKPDQIIQPWQFGHGETKATCLWLQGLSLLKPTNIVDGREARIHRMPPRKDRALLRSITYSGIAEAMAAQWG